MCTLSLIALRSSCCSSRRTSRALRVSFAVGVEGVQPRAAREPASARRARASASLRQLIDVYGAAKVLESTGQRRVPLFMGSTGTASDLPRKLLPTYRGLAAPGVRRRSLRHNGKSLKFPRSRVSGDALRRLPVEAARSAHPLRASAQAPLRNPPVVRARAQRLSWLRILSIAPRPLTAQPSTSTAHALRTRSTVLLRTAATCCGRLPQPWPDPVVGPRAAAASRRYALRRVSTRTATGSM